MNKMDEIIGRLRAQEPVLRGAEELTERIMEGLPEQVGGNRTVRRWGVAAGIAIVLCMGVGAAVYYGGMVSWGTAEREVEIEVVGPAMESQGTEYFVFDNVEMEVIAGALGEYYGVEAVFEREEAKHVRLYLSVEKSKSIEEVVELLNHFSKVNVTIKDRQLIIK